MSYKEEHRKDLKKRVCSRCYFWEICPIDHDCHALELVETYEDILSNNTEL